MENKRSPSCQSRTPASTTLAMHKNSHAISKPKQNIRIVHIAPVIIKTDATNFREVVQRLTGMPEKKKKEEEAITAIRSQHEGEFRMKKKKKKGDEDHEMWSCDGCFDGLGDVDGFMQGFTDD
ncbi:hypothetical protein J5N97_001964 [Dioscorea zingiberensis]|uniref:VQ domain-containing protein n=1 Tax=Dioscorea zingiberensis TaxID=325984 RepID=A0A9D5BTA8_9LILI|nr:hypothetical protein J5N97_001964 [Dioscorea zingiberensis]